MPGWEPAASFRPLPPNWPSIRRACLKRDNYTCQNVIDGLLCGEQANQADHIIPRAQGGPDELWNLRALCKACHDVISRKQPRNRRGYQSAAPKRIPGFFAK